jgi:hypothetical protein
MLQNLNRDLQLFFKVPFSSLAALGFFLMPFDSVVFFPVDTVYRPVWILPFCVIGVNHFFFKYRLDKSIFKFLIIILYMILSTIFFNFYFSYPDFSGIYKLVFVLNLLFFGVLGLNEFFKFFFKTYSSELVLKIFSSVIVYFSIFPILIGIIQIPGELLGNFDFNGKISSFFSYRYSPGRIHLVTGEPSWAARYILFVFMFSLFCEGYIIYFLRLLLFILLLFTGSTIGILSAVLLSVSFFLFRIKLSLSFVFKGIFLFLFLHYFFANYREILWFSSYSVTKIDKVIFLLSTFSFQTLMAVAAIDGSVLARFINPIIAFDLSISYPFGIGGESFKFWILEMLEDYGYSGSSSDNYILSSGSTPKLFIAKILVEFGFMFTFVILFYYFKIFFRLKNPKTKFLLFSVLIMTLSDDSFLFYGLIVPVVFTGVFSIYNTE